MKKGYWLGKSDNLKIKPQNNQVIISWKDNSKEDLSKEMEKLGLALPEETQGREQMVEMGEVIALADQIINVHGDEMDIKKGDKILFSTFVVVDLKINGKSAYAINAKDIIAIL